MAGLSTPRSEVACLLAQISSKYEAAQQSLSGLAQGTCQYQFITRRMECIGALDSQLHSLVDDEAMALIAVQLDHASEVEHTMEQGKEGQGKQVN